MYINSVIYQSHFSGMQTESVSNRVKDYFYDLYRIYKKDMRLNLIKPVYRYADLGSLLMEKLRLNGNLSNLEFLFLPLWAPSWNMDFATPELYLKNKFNIVAQLIDVRGTGRLCVFYAIYLLLQLVDVSSKKISLCCSIENACSSFSHEDMSFLPEINYIASFAFSAMKEKSSFFKILQCSIVQVKDLIKFLDSNMNLFNIKNTDSVVYSCRIKNKIVDHRFIHIEHRNSSGFLYSCIDFILKSDIKVKYVFVVDYDVIEKLAGLILLEFLI
ncbi:MAG: hypothetical protein NTZ67_02035 [Gammaproteobacteria bacterium]|nr:hypothetical protein [Gammaproteobacteria bacterium]